MKAHQHNGEYNGVVIMSAVRERNISRRHVITVSFCHPELQVNVDKTSEIN